MSVGGLVSEPPSPSPCKRPLLLSRRPGVQTDKIGLKKAYNVGVCDRDCQHYIFRGNDRLYLSLSGWEFLLFWQTNLGKLIYPSPHQFKVCLKVFLLFSPGLSFICLYISVILSLSNSLSLSLCLSLSLSLACSFEFWHPQFTAVYIISSPLPPILWGSPVEYPPLLPPQSRERERELRWRELKPTT